MKKIIVVLSALFLWGTAFAEENGEHYCDDAQGWADWRALVQKYPEDDNLRAGYALRLGLCQEVKDGTIETARAVSIFERFMDAMKTNAEHEERLRKQSIKEKGI